MKPPARGEWRRDTAGLVTAGLVTLLCAVSVSHGGKTNQGGNLRRIVFFFVFFQSFSFHIFPERFVVALINCKKKKNLRSKNSQAETFRNGADGFNFSTLRLLTAFVRFSVIFPGETRHQAVCNWDFTFCTRNCCNGFIIEWDEL